MTMLADQRMVASVHAPEQVELVDFAPTDKELHMLEWIRRGSDFRRFVTNDVERELYAQDPRSQLLRVECKSRPSFETQLRQVDSENRAFVTQMLIVFPLALRVRSGSGEIWRLEVEHSYHAMNMDSADQFQLKLGFNVLGHQIEQPNQAAPRKINELTVQGGDFLVQFTGPELMEYRSAGYTAYLSWGHAPSERAVHIYASTVQQWTNGDGVQAMQESLRKKMLEDISAAVTLLSGKYVLV